MKTHQFSSAPHYFPLLRLQVLKVILLVHVVILSLSLASIQQIDAFLLSPQRHGKIHLQNVPFQAKKKSIIYSLPLSSSSLPSSSSTTTHRISTNTGQEEAEGKVQCQQQHHQCNNKKEDENKNNNQIAIMSRRKALLTTGLACSSILTLSSVASKSNAMETKTLRSMSSVAVSSSTPTTNSVSASTISTAIDELSVLPSMSTATSISTTLQETISGFVSGATITTAKTFVKYPLDTVTVRLQMKPTPTIKNFNNVYDLFRGSYNGVSTPLLSNIPAGALFFAVKDATKSMLKQQQVQVLPKWLSTCIAVGVALPPYWFLRNPSEVLKTRLQIAGTNTAHNGSIIEEGKVPSAFEAIQTIYKNNQNNTIDTIKELYTGYSENVLYAYPADVIKFVAYEALSSSSKNSGNNKTNGKVSPLQGALYGAGATAIAQFVTTPLDVVRNRVMVADTKSASGSASTSTNRSTDTSEKKASYIDTLATLAKEEGLKGLFAGATPRIGKAILSGAIQFATYEETKESVRKIFEKK